MLWILTKQYTGTEWLVNISITNFPSDLLKIKDEQRWYYISSKCVFVLMENNYIMTLIEKKCDLQGKESIPKSALNILKWRSFHFGSRFTQTIWLCD